MKTEELLTVEDVADYLNVSKMSVYRIIKRKELHALRVGRLYRIPASSLSEYLEKGRASA